MPEEISDSEREFVQDVADQAMIRGWDDAIAAAARESGISDSEVRLMLNKAQEYNDKADPHGRIEELEDWAVEKRGRSELAGSASRRIESARKKVKQDAPSASYRPSSSSGDSPRKRPA